jgi:hypothetical protein
MAVETKTGESIEERIARLSGGMGSDIRDVMQPKAESLTPPKPEPVSLTMPPEMVETLRSVQAQAQQGVNENRVLAELLSDPDIAAVIKARRAGQQIQIQPRVAQAPAVEELAADETDPRKIADHMGRTLLSKIESVIDQKLAPRDQQIQSVLGILQQEGASRADAEVKKLSESQEDFEQMRPLMKQINQEIGGKGVSIPELYALAKLRSGMPLTRDTSTDTERPTMPAAPNGGPLGKKFAPGVVGQRQMLDEALSRRRPGTGTNNE